MVSPAPSNEQQERDTQAIIEGSAGWAGFVKFMEKFTLSPESRGFLKISPYLGDLAGEAVAGAIGAANYCDPAVYTLGKLIGDKTDKTLRRCQF
jgi:hypothetical protein